MIGCHIYVITINVNNDRLMGMQFKFDCTTLFMPKNILTGPTSHGVWLIYI